MTREQKAQYMVVLVVTFLAGTGLEILYHLVWHAHILNWAAAAVVLAFTGYTLWLQKRFRDSSHPAA